MYKMIRNFILLLISLSLFFIWLSKNQTVSDRQAVVTPSGKITDQKSAQHCLDLVKKNLTAATEKNLKAYLATLSDNAQEATKKELSNIYSSYDLEHKLIAFEILEQQSNSLFVEAFQQTFNRGTTHYQNHIAQIHYTFMLEAGEWKIADAVITTIEQID